MVLAYAGAVGDDREPDGEGPRGEDRIAATARLCARVGCREPAVATLTADYEGRLMAVGPLSPAPQPPALDLCTRHRDTLSAPEGWELLRHASEDD